MMDSSGFEISRVGRDWLSLMELKNLKVGSAAFACCRRKRKKKENNLGEIILNKRCKIKRPGEIFSWLCNIFQLVINKKVPIQSGLLLFLKKELLLFCRSSRSSFCLLSSRSSFLHAFLSRSSFFTFSRSSSCHFYRSCFFHLCRSRLGRRRS